MPTPTTILVLGLGRVGSLLAAELARGCPHTTRIHAVDASEHAGTRTLALANSLGHSVESRLSVATDNLADPARVHALASKADFVVGALPSSLGLAAMHAVIDAGRNAVDISFAPEDPIALHEHAKSKGVTLVPDMGVAPGMSHLLSAHLASKLDRCDEITIMVGGLPIVRTRPFEYKAAFSPLDVIEEYTRPARLRRLGHDTTLEALTDVELVDFHDIGTLEAFNTDGLRTLLRTNTTPTMVEKTLRYPGHADQMRLLRSLGLFSKAPIRVRDTSGVERDIAPIEIAAKLLLPHWAYPHEHATCADRDLACDLDLTVMRVEARGMVNNKPKTFRADLSDRALVVDVGHTRVVHTSMARTTAYPAAVVARAMTQGLITRKGVVEPERLAEIPGLVDRVLAELANLGVRYTMLQS